MATVVKDREKTKKGALVIGRWCIHVFLQRDGLCIVFSELHGIYFFHHGTWLCIIDMYLHFAVYRGFHSLLLIQISCIEKNGRVLSISFVVYSCNVFFFCFRIDPAGTCTFFLK